MGTACAPHALVIRTPRWPWRRVSSLLVEAMQAWRTAVQQQRRLRALQGLSERTRRDIGLADEWPQPPGGVTLADHERMRW